MDNASLSERENVSDIQELTSRIERLSTAADFWNKAMLWGLVAAALAAVFIVITTRLAITRAKQAADAQGELDKAKDRDLQTVLKDKDIAIGHAQQDASDAKATQQRVETELIKQKERTASAEKAASDAALALAKFKEPRFLSPEQQDKLITDAKPFAGRNFAFAVFPDPESLALARLLDGLLKSAGWKRVPSQIERQGGVLTEVAGETAATIFDSGIDAYIALDDTESVPAQMAFCSALRSAGIQCETHRTPQLNGKNPRAITIAIGKKP